MCHADCPRTKDGISFAIEYKQKEYKQKENYSFDIIPTLQQRCDSKLFYLEILSSFAPDYLMYPYYSLLPIYCYHFVINRINASAIFKSYIRSEKITCRWLLRRFNKIIRGTSPLSNQIFPKLIRKSLEKSIHGLYTISCDGDSIGGLSVYAYLK